MIAIYSSYHFHEDGQTDFVLLIYSLRMMKLISSHSRVDFPNVVYSMSIGCGKLNLKCPSHKVVCNIERVLASNANNYFIRGLINTSGAYIGLRVAHKTISKACHTYA